jgi:glutamate-1-semialdehyde 2,1-aminomutase
MTTDTTIATTLLPGGCGRSTLAIRPRAPLAIRGSGYELVVEDGRRLIDANNNFMSLIHGHCHPAIVEELATAATEGLSFGLPNPWELEHAARIVSRVEHAEQVRYSNSGTEAVMLAVRLARANTGRAKMVVIQGAYHGTSEVALAAGGPRGRRGVSQRALDEVELIAINDQAGLRAVFEREGESIAAVLLDLMPNRCGLIALEPEFVDAARELTTAAGSMLVFDEVVTLRHCYGGLQTEYAAVPDLTVTGKLIGGGLAIGAVLGTAKVMEPLDPYQPDGMEHGGTFTANPLAMRAGIIAMDLYGPDEVDRLTALGDQLAGLLRDRSDELGWELRWRGSLLRLVPRDGVLSERATDLFHAAYENDVLMMPTGTMALSTAMSEQVIEQIAGGVIAALERVRV